jgi:uncharacterized membrane protein YccC
VAKVASNEVLAVRGQRLGARRWPIGLLGAGAMAARLGIFLYGIFTVVAVMVAGLTAVIAVEYPSPDTTMLIALGFACAAAIWAFGRGVRFVLTGPR